MTLAPVRRRTAEFSTWFGGQQVALLLASWVILAIHFRPGQGVLLEEWDHAIRSFSWGFYTALRHEILAWPARPIHNIASVIGSIQGQTWGFHAMASLFALAQFWLARWAVKPLIRFEWLVIALAFVISMSPWWQAGLLLRFLGAQQSLVAAIWWFGLTIRYALSGEKRLLLPMVIAMLLTILSYQAPAGPMLIAACAMAGLSVLPRRRLITIISVNFITVGVFFAWAIILVPRLFPESYDFGGIGSNSMPQLTRVLLQTFAKQLPSLLILMALLAACTLLLHQRSRITGWQFGILLISLALAPLTALVFAGQVGWLQDQERIAIPIGLSLWFTGTLLAGSTWGSQFDTPNLDAQDSLSSVSGRVAAAAIVAATLAGSFVNYQSISKYGNLQQGLLAELVPLLQDNDQLIIVDPTGTFGRHYTFLGSINLLQSAVNLITPIDAQVEICSPQTLLLEYPDLSTRPCESLVADVQTEIIARPKVIGKQLEIHRITSGCFAPRESVLGFTYMFVDPADGTVWFDGQNVGGAPSIPPTCR